MNLKFTRIASALLMAAAVTVGGVLETKGQTVLFTDDFESESPSGFTRVLAPAVDFPNGQFNDPGNGDVFGIVDNTASFAISDESATSFPSDTQGFADSTKTDLFLGFTDTVNDLNPDPDADGGVLSEVSVVWTFDVTGQSNLGLSFDVAAMGNFEGPLGRNDPNAPFAFDADTLSFTASIDGGAAQEIAFGTGQDGGTLSYTLESGTVTELGDPFAIGTRQMDNNVVGTVIDNNFQNLSFAIPGSGSSLELTLVARFDGGAEALGIDNLQITAGNTGGLPGDFDNDGDVDVDDIDAYAAVLGQSATGNEEFDFVEDGNITLADLQFHVENYVMTNNGQTGTFLGDLNLDGTVNVLGDAFTIVGNLNGPATSYAQGDLNLDGTVNVLGDAFTLVGNLGSNNNPGSSASASAVPEPGTLSLLTIAAVGLAARRKRA